jgi:hypothetical protein
MPVFSPLLLKVCLIQINYNLVFLYMMDHIEKRFFFYSLSCAPVVACISSGETASYAWPCGGAGNGTRTQDPSRLASSDLLLCGTTRNHTRYTSTRGGCMDQQPQRLYRCHTTMALAHQHMHIILGVVHAQIY